MNDAAQRLIEEEEGRSGCVYKDSRGYDTIGVGCLVDARVMGAGLCDEAIDAQFAHDSAAARADAAMLPGYQRLNETQQAALISMCFQLGDLHDWPNFKAALAMGDMAAAYTAGKASLWYSQTPKRAERELTMLRTGVWVQR